METETGTVVETGRFVCGNTHVFFFVVPTLMLHYVSNCSSWNQSKPLKAENKHRRPGRLR